MSTTPNALDAVPMDDDELEVPVVPVLDDEVTVVPVLDDEVPVVPVLDDEVPVVPVLDDEVVDVAAWVKGNFIPLLEQCVPKEQPKYTGRLVILYVTGEAPSIVEPVKSQFVYAVSEANTATV